MSRPPIPLEPACVWRRVVAGIVVFGGIIVIELPGTCGCLAVSAAPPTIRQPAGRSDAPSRPHVLARLRAGKPITLVAYGDSLTYGQGVRDAPSESYPNVWLRGLRQFFGKDRIRLVNVSDPGVVSWYAAKFIDSHVVAQQPDLVLLQFGGNDSRTKVPLDTFIHAMEQMSARLQEKTSADVVLIVPPMLEKSEDYQIIDALWRLAQRRRLVVADFNRVLKQHPYDARGLFPLNEHPTAYSQKLMAQELVRACAPLFGLDTALSIGIRDMSWVVVPGQPVTLAAGVKNASRTSAAVTALMELSAPETKPVTDTLTVAAGKTAELHLTTRCPPPSPRSRQFRLWSYAATKTGFAFDQKWVTFAPLITCPRRVAGAAPGPAALTLGRESVEMGREAWTGDDDLSARVWLARTDTALRVTVRVRDDRLVRDFTEEVVQNDCVELYVDARPEREQGRLFYGTRTFALFLKPPTPAYPDPEVTPLSPLPFEAQGVHATGRLEPDGYSVEVTIPLEVFRTTAGELLPRFGFDVVVDDADTPGWRETQLVWAGRRDDSLNPSCFGVVQLTGDAPSGAVRVTVR